MKVEASLMVQNPADADQLAKEMEELGFEGVYTFEGQHDPFFPLVVAAEHTQKIELTTAIAVAFARNPMLLANIGYDLQLMSKGRFNLGLGSQIRPHIENRYGMPWSQPAARMRDMVKAIRAIWRCWNTGDKLDYRGEFYTHTLMTPVFAPGPNPFGNPKIFIAGVGSRMTEVVGEVGDGMLIHPLHSAEFIAEQTLPALQRGFESASKNRENFEISCQVIVVTGETEEEFENAKSLARNQIAFYASTAEYKPVLDQHGWGELQPRLNVLSKQGKWNDMSALVDDEMLETIALVGTPAEIGAKVRAGRGTLVDRISPVAYTQNSELMKKMADEIRGSSGAAIQ